MVEVELTKREEDGRSGEAADAEGEAVERRVLAPEVDVYENEHELLLVADLPGVSREDLHIEVDDEQLSIEAHRGETEADGRELACEFRLYDYRRRFTLPEGIDTEKISAQLAAGILTMHLPKRAGPSPRKVEVKSVS